MAGVFAVCETLCRIGHTPFLPSVDTGTDIMLDNGLKIQVKASNLKASHPGYDYGVYHFDWRQNTRAAWQRYLGREYKSGEGLAHVQKHNDFLVMFAATERRFFVVPCSELQSDCAYILPRNSPVLNRVKNPSPKTFGRKLLQYEDAWHLLDVDAVAEAAIEEVEQEVISS
jgi:hypothetical protein